MNATPFAASATTSSKPATTASAAGYEPTREQWDALRAQFHHFNRELFGGELPEVILNMSRHARSRGFFAPGRWRSAKAEGEAQTHEISLNPDHLGREPRAVASTLVHEMCHLWQEVFGTQRSRGYHDKEWGTKMEAIGLMPSSTGMPGGKRVGRNMTHYIIEGGPFALAWAKLEERHMLPWRSGIACLNDASAPAPKKKDPSKVKYTCKCGFNVWGKKSLNLSCNECGHSFNIADP